MAITDLLDCTVTVYTGDETLDPTTRRPVAGTTVRHRAVPAAFTVRSAVTTVYDEAGRVLTDHDCTITVPVTVGDIIVSTAGTTTGRFVVTSEPRVGVKRRTGRVHHYTVPCRRIG